MSTRSGIARLNPDGSLDVIYCHSDGYLDHTGRILREHYTDASKVDALIALGDLSLLREDLGAKHDFHEWPIPAEHKTWTTAYKRDRNEKGTEAQNYISIEELLGEGRENLGASYVYVFTSDGWQWSYAGAPLCPLTSESKEVSE